VSQQDNSRAAVERLRVERAGATDPEYAAALDNQIRLHSELAGLYLGVADELEKLAEKWVPELEAFTGKVTPKPSKPKPGT
jgi:hypothetical protein